MASYVVDLLLHIHTQGLGLTTKVSLRATSIALKLQNDGWTLTRRREKNATSFHIFFKIQILWCMWKWVTFSNVLLTPGCVGNRVETPLTDSVAPPLAAYPVVPKRQEVYSTLEFRLRPPHGSQQKTGPLATRARRLNKLLKQDIKSGFHWNVFELWFESWKGVTSHNKVNLKGNCKNDFLSDKSKRSHSAFSLTTSESKLKWFEQAVLWYFTVTHPTMLKNAFNSLLSGFACCSKCISKIKSKNSALNNITTN